MILMFSYITYDELGDVKRFRTLKEAKWFAEQNNLLIKATGYKQPTRLDEYTRASEDCGPALF